MQSPSPVQTGVTRLTRKAMRVETATDKGTMCISSVLLSKFTVLQNYNNNNNNLYCAINTKEAVK